MFKLVLICLLEILWCMCDLLIKPRVLPYNKGFKRESSCKSFDFEAYKKLPKKSFTIESDFGYKLSCELVEAMNNNDNKLAILCHGLGCAKYNSIKYMELFLELGYSVLMYDHRNHGLSGKAYTTMGFYEKYDLKKVVDWCISTYGSDIKLVTHGESMGGTTVLLHLAIDDRIKCAVADCAYSDLRQLIRHQLKQYYHLPCCFIPVAGIITYLRAGFWYKEVSPINVICRVETPVLFIHGKIDNFVPSYMSKEMYKCKEKNKAIFLVAKARHAQSYCHNKEKYKRVVEQFLLKYMKQL